MVLWCAIITVKLERNEIRLETKITLVFYRIKHTSNGSILTLMGCYFYLIRHVKILHIIRLTPAVRVTISLKFILVVCCNCFLTGCNSHQCKFFISLIWGKKRSETWKMWNILSKNVFEYNVCLPFFNHSVIVLIHALLRDKEYLYFESNLDLFFRWSHWQWVSICSGNHSEPCMFHTITGANFGLIPYYVSRIYWID